MKITSKMRFGFMLLVLSSSMMLYSCGDKIISKPVEMCDTPDLSCIMFFKEVFGYFPETSCPTNVVLKPGDTITLQIYSPTVLHGTAVNGCSSNPWTLTATPTAGVSVTISKESPPACSATAVLLAQSAAPGLPVSISGTTRCMVGKGELIGIVGGGAVGTVDINFN